MNRRKFFGLLGGVAVASQLPADDKVYFKGVHIPLDDQFQHKAMWVNEHGVIVSGNHPPPIWNERAWRDHVRCVISQPEFQSLRRDISLNNV